jgi:endonuclease/exonuclease/phosphatase family metal-dependent hydrolase
MRITSWNFLHAQPLTAGASSSESLALLAPDVIGLQEVDYRLSRSEGRVQAEEIAEAISATSWGFAPTISGTPGVKWRKLRHEERVVITDTHDQNGYYGLAIASKIPVIHWLRLELGRSLIGMPLAVANESGKLRLLYVKDEPRVAMAAVLDNGYAVVNLHLSFVPLVNTYQLFKVSRWCARLEKLYGVKVILLGDFNLPWGIPSKLTQWKRATQALTYPSWSPKISFDYILATNTDGLVEITHPQQPVSDHHPISIEI